MSYFLRVFCKSSELLPSKEILDFIQNGYFFDEMPRFEFQNGAVNTSQSDWQSIKVHYQNGKHPITIERNVNDQLLRQEIKEIIESLALSHLSNKQAEIIHHLSNSKQVIAIEIDPIGLIDAGWEMLDCLEARLASTLSGIVYAPDEGFYDEKLQPIWQLNGHHPTSLTTQTSPNQNNIAVGR